MSTVADRVIKVVSEHFDVKPEEVQLESKFIEDLGADSLDTVDIIMAIEEEFDSEIDDSDAEKFVAVKDVVNHLEALVEA